MQFAAKKNITLSEVFQDRERNRTNSLNTGFKKKWQENNRHLKIAETEMVSLRGNKSLFWEWGEGFDTVEEESTHW